MEHTLLVLSESLVCSQLWDLTESLLVALIEKQQNHFPPLKAGRKIYQGLSLPFFFQGLIRASSTQEELAVPLGLCDPEHGAH